MPPAPPKIPPVDLSTESPIGLSLIDILCNIAEWIFDIALVLAVIAFLAAAFYYLTSSGSEQRINKGKTALTFAALGAAITLLAWGAIFILADILGGTSSSITSCP